MKKILLLCFFSIGFTMLTKAQQLQFSTWTRFDTYFNDTVFRHFNMNTCTNSTPDGLLVSSTYTEVGNVFTIQDVFGSNPCSNSVIGTYTFTIVNGTALYFTLVEDACTARANSLTEGVFTRVPPKTIHIPADFPHIQQGIMAADKLDTVLVDPGTYYENINFLGKKPLLVASRFIMDGDTNQIANTIINGSQPLDPDLGSVVTMVSGEDTTSVLCGFTITGGTGTFLAAAGNGRAGGGLFITGSGAKLLNNYIENNIISNNEGWASGGGITAAGPDEPLEWLVLRNNRINNNQAISQIDAAEGGGFYCSYNLILKDNQISYNSADGYLGGNGGGVVIMGGSGPITIDVTENEITHNEGATTTGTTDYNVFGGGISILYDVTGTVSKNDISYNRIDAPGNHESEGAGAFIGGVSPHNFKFENNIIQHNYTITTQSCSGGGLAVLESNGHYLNNVIQHNSAPSGGGISIRGVNNNAVFINNTITGNTATVGGGGIYIQLSTAVIINSIITENNSPIFPSIKLYSGNLNVRYSDVAGDVVWPGEGNVNCHATFLEDGYHLSDTCELMEKGIASILINGAVYFCPAYDIDGEGRPLNDFPEIGADEALLPVSVSEPMPANKIAFNIYPNPASGKITLELNEATSGIMGDVSIIGLTGRELFHLQVTGPKTEINVNALPAGVYFIKLIPHVQNAAVKVGKFVIK